jgi:hypothetical protein
MDGKNESDEKTHRLQESLLLVMGDDNDEIHSARYSKADLDSVVSAVLARNKKLGGYIYQLIRVVRLASICSGNKPYQDFFFGRGGRVNQSYFEHAIRTAIEENRLPDTVVEMGEETIYREDKEKVETIDFVEPQMFGTVDKARVPFRLSYGNLPPLAALFEILWYVLGTVHLSSILAPIMQRHLDPDMAAEEVAQSLHAEFVAWLDDALGKSNASRQAVFIQRYLTENRALQAERINDAMVFNFWAAHAQSDRDSNEADNSDRGFRRYKNAATCLLRFARALLLLSGARDDLIPLKAVNLPKSDVWIKPTFMEETDTQDFFARASFEWKSPIISLFSSPCDKVKWLSDRELDTLGNFLHGCGLARAQSSDDDIEGAGAVIPKVAADKAVANVIAYAKLDRMDKDEGSLMGIDRFKLRFTRTLLRADSFGAVQNRITQALRTKKNPRTQMPSVSVDLYADLRNAYLEVCDRVVGNMLASMDQFMTRPNPSDENGALDAKAIEAFLTLLLRIGPPGVIEYFYGKVDASIIGDIDLMNPRERLDRARSIASNAVRARFGSIQQGKTGNAEVDVFLRKVKQARNQRVGFKDTDYLDPGVRQAHTRAAHHLVALLDEMESLNDAIQRTLKADGNAFGADCQKFTQVFEKMYFA